jgi:hypothetical protein
MKRKIPAVFVLVLVLAAACANRPIAPSYRPVLPRLPSHWEEVLGSAHWRLEWVDEGGVWREQVVFPGREAPFLSLMSEWSTPVLAWPFWPSRDMEARLMRPAGALFPWDVSGTDKLQLSWETGVEAFFWKELAAATRSTAAAAGRLPWYFDWPRFRDLLYESGDVPEPVRQDPWLSDWKDIAQRTVTSGFDRRRIVSRKYTEMIIPDLGGLWVNSSPFAPPIEASPDGKLKLNVTATPDTWVSAARILKCSSSGWVLR